jgi:hypothetical protein
VEQRHDCGCGDAGVHRRRFLQLGTGAALGAIFSGVLRGTPAGATQPHQPHFGSRIDPYAAYDGQDTCDPTPKPGTLDLQDLLLTTYPGTQDWGISRDCAVGGVSEHKEGRAFDWGVPTDANERDAQDLIRWLLARDQYGNHHAMARRLGIMYFIHNGKIWRAYPPGPGFGPRDCDPHADFDDCHVDHIHFSMSWAGALRQTTWWHPHSTFGAADTAYWKAGAAGDIEPGGSTEAPLHEGC